MSSIFFAPAANFLSTTLNGAINDSVQTITLNSTTNVNFPGYIVIDRTNSSGTSTPNAREVIFFTGVSGSNLTGCTRAADNSTARSHANGAIVEFTPTVGLWNSLASAVSQVADGNGYLRAIPSPVTIGYGEFKSLAVGSIASIGQLQTNAFSISNITVTGSIGASGASITGLAQTVPIWVFVGTMSGATISPMTAITMPRQGTWDFVNFITRTVSSGASSFIDINKNGTSIFDAATRPTIAGAGTFYSSASIATKTFSRGDRFTWDFDATAVGGAITDFDIMLVSR